MQILRRSNFGSAAVSAIAAAALFVGALAGREGVASVGAAAASPTPVPVEQEYSDNPTFSVRIVETGEGFHGDEVPAKNGETWLGLFKRGDKYVLENAKVRIKAVYDPIVDLNEHEKTGKSVSTDAKGPAVLLLKDAPFIRPGAAETVFYSEDTSDDTNLTNGYRKEFNFNGSVYVLRVENAGTAEKPLTKGSKLVLGKDGQEQVLRFLDDGCDDCSWQLYWAGDIDRDGGLDLYIDLTSHYNVMDKRLFLSSKAAKGKLVRNVAQFHLTGC